MTANTETPYDAEIALTRGEHQRAWLMAKAEGYRKALEDLESRKRGGTGATKRGEVNMNCASCNKELKPGDYAYGTLLGQVREEAFGFTLDLIRAWEEIMCTECYREKKKTMEREAVL